MASSSVLTLNASGTGASVVFDVLVPAFSEPRIGHELNVRLVVRDSNGITQHTEDSVLRLPPGVTAGRTVQHVITVPPPIGSMLANTMFDTTGSFEVIVVSPVTGCDGVVLSAGKVVSSVLRPVKIVHPSGSGSGCCGSIGWSQ